MPISPWPIGQTKAMTFTVYDDEHQPVNFGSITANQCAFVVYNANQTAVVLTGTGTFTIVNAVGGVVQYVPAATDSSTPGPGNYFVRVKLTAGVGFSDFISWVVQL